MFVHSSMWSAEVWFCNIWTVFACVWMSWLDANLLWQYHDEKQLLLSNSLSRLTVSSYSYALMKWPPRKYGSSLMKGRVGLCQPDCCVKWTAHAFFWCPAAGITQTLSDQILQKLHVIWEIYLTILKHFHCALYIWIHIKSSFSFPPDSFHYLRPEIAWTGRATQLSQSPAFSNPELVFSTDRDSKFIDLAIKIKLLRHRMAHTHSRQIKRAFSV